MMYYDIVATVCAYIYDVAIVSVHTHSHYHDVSSGINIDNNSSGASDY